MDMDRGIKDIIIKDLNTSRTVASQKSTGWPLARY
jgi:hypothetical protein